MRLQAEQEGRRGHLRSLPRLDLVVDTPGAEVDGSAAVSDETRELIAALRGGWGTRCDYCGEDKPPEELDPDEGGTWCCKDCWQKAVQWGRR